MRYILLEIRHHLKELTTHIGFRRLENLLRRNRQQTDELSARLGAALEGRIKRLRHRYTIAGTRIASFDLRAKIRAHGLRRTCSAPRNWHEDGALVGQQNTAPGAPAVATR